MINIEKLDETLLSLGHAENLTGTRYLRLAVGLYDDGLRCVYKQVYPALALRFDTTPQSVERCIRHAVSRAWMRGDYDAQRRIFGYTVNPNTGVPTNSEYIARLARLCHED